MFEFVFFYEKTFIYYNIYNIYIYRLNFTNKMEYDHSTILSALFIRPKTDTIYFYFCYIHKSKLIQSYKYIKYLYFDTYLSDFCIVILGFNVNRKVAGEELLLRLDSF